MVHIPVKLNMQNPWYNMWNVLGRGYIRLPIIITGAYFYNTAFNVPYHEKFWLWLNEGHNQIDMWNEVEKRTKLKKEGQWKTAEE